jgi:hypothetical protein
MVGLVVALMHPGMVRCEKKRGEGPFSCPPALF